MRPDDRQESLARQDAALRRQPSFDGIAGRGFGA